MTGLWIVCFLAYFALRALAVKKDSEKLLLVHTIWRHGLVTPPYDFVHPMGGTPRESRPEGLVESFRLGKLLADRYMDNMTLLDSSKTTSQVYIRSIDYNRSLTSAAALLAGMFPVNLPVLEKTKGWPSNWVPIPIHTIPIQEDMYLFMGAECPVAYAEDGNTTFIPEFNRTLRKYQHVFDYLTNVTDMNVTSDNIGLVWASLTRLPKSETPHWVNESLLNRMQYLAKQNLHYRLRNKKLVKFRGGPLANDILNRMETKLQSIRNKTRPADPFHQAMLDLKFYGYSCRGMPILWQLASLGDVELTDDRIPRYSSCLTYELWEKNDRAYVSVYYYAGADSKAGFVPIQISECPKLPALCPLETIRTALKPYLLDAYNWTKECGLINATSLEAEATYRSLSIIFGIIIIILTTFVILELCVILRPKPSSVTKEHKSEELIEVHSCHTKSSCGTTVLDGT